MNKTNFWNIPGKTEIQNIMPEQQNIEYECQKSFDRMLDKTSDELKNSWIALFDKITNNTKENTQK